LTICEKNTLTCPVVFNIFEKLDKLTSKWTGLN
jgi:hypothetical protein